MDMYEVGAVGGLGAFFGLIAMVASIGFLVFVPVMLIFINLNTKDIRHHLMAINENLLALRKAGISQAPGASRPDSTS